MTSAAAASASSSGLASSSNGPPLIAQGDWTKNLVHLAKTAELKKHALTLQLHTAHILSAHAALDQKNKAIQDLKEQKNKLESERQRLLNCLREVNEDRDKTDLMEVTLNKECSDLQTKIKTITEGEYASAKADVDRLRQELGQAPMPTLQATIDEKSQQYLKELRQQSETLNATSTKRSSEELSGGGGASGGVAAGSDPQPTGKRPRGRPKGSKTKTKIPVVPNISSAVIMTPSSVAAAASGGGSTGGGRDTGGTGSVGSPA